MRSASRRHLRPDPPPEGRRPPELRCFGNRQILGGLDRRTGEFGSGRAVEPVDHSTVPPVALFPKVPNPVPSSHWKQFLQVPASSW